MPVRQSTDLRFFNELLQFSFAPSIGMVAKDFETFGVNVKSFREPLMRSIRQVMVPSIRTNFDVGGRPPWIELSEFAEKRHQDEGAKGGILVKSGALRRVATQINIWTVTKEAASVQGLPERVWYGYIHQKGYGLRMKRLIEKLPTGGNESKAAGIPPRPFILFQDEDVEKIEEVFLDWIDERIERDAMRTASVTTESAVTGGDDGAD